MRGECFNKSVKLQLAASSDACRLVMNFVHFRKGYAYVTNGRILVRAWLPDICSCPQEQIDKLDGWSITPSLYKKVLQSNDVEICDGEIVCTIAGDKIGYKLTKLDQKYRLPDYEAVLKPVLEESAVPTATVSFSALVLKDALDAMGARGRVQFKFRKPGGAVLLKDTFETRNIVCVVMPMMED